MSSTFAASDRSIRRSPDAPRVERRLTLISIVGFWVFYFVLNSLRMSIELGGPQWELMSRRTIVTLTGMVLTFIFSLVLGRLERRSTGVLVTAVFLAAVPVSVTYAIVNMTMFYSIDRAEAEREAMARHFGTIHETIYQISDSAVSWYFFIVAWGILYVALSYAARVRHAERTAAMFRAEAQSAQLRALRYQVNPHFLFNTLNSLSALILHQRSDEAERMVMNLANFFRSSLTADPTEDVPLAEEIRMQRLYLEIEQTRFPDRLKVTVELPRELEAAPVPGLILQPLVENAIKHGVARSLAPVTIAIRARTAAGRLILVVEDDAKPGTEPEHGCGLGLRNVRERLAARFDGEAACSYGPKPGGGYAVHLLLPMQGSRMEAA